MMPAVGLSVCSAVAALRQIEPANLASRCLEEMGGLPLLSVVQITFAV
jgi:hypothetical protein